MSTNGGERLDPAPLMQLATAYWSSQTFLTANRLGVFALLAERPRVLEELAVALGAGKRATRLFARALVALGLLEENENAFRNSALADAFLVPGKPGYMGNAVRYSDNLYLPWGNLEDALHESRPVVEPETYLGDDPDTTRDFVYGMHDRALGIGHALVRLVDLSGRRRMLDVGGGPGTYSALLTRQYTGLEATVLELPQVAAVARDILASMGASEAVSVLPGDYLQSEFPHGNDVVLISGVLHREREATCRDLLTRAIAALEPGGLLVVSDVFTDAGGASPVFAALFGLNMLLTARDGGVHADRDVAEWMRAAGASRTEIRPFPPPMPHRVIIGYTGDAKS